ncbi:MAG: ABC transporter ATP-binding protein [Chloroflexi bacterium]|nr:ABC transporter ATP-binding protein [Chloroflexota bacterium]
MKTTTDTPVLETKDITKTFPGTLANSKVSIRLEQGEVLALLGENGAGKTTLMNIIYGLYDQDSGEIFLNGEPYNIRNPHDAIAAGIGMVHQHFMLVPVFTVLENIMLGAEVMKGPFLNKTQARQEILELSNRYGLEVDPDAVVEDLPVGIQQRVEILKALFRDVKILILDEPTAVLTPQEIQELFQIMRHLTESGVSIVFITHKLKEVLEIADRIVIMRRGEVVGEANPRQVSEHDLANLMVGREVSLVVDKSEAAPKGVQFEVKDLVVKDPMKGLAVNHVSFAVRAGEVLGIAGVQGNGQTELAEAMTGLRKHEGGTVWISGMETPQANPRALVEHGMAHIPEDRHKHGLILQYPLTDNFVLCTYYKEPYSKHGVRNKKAILTTAEELIKRFDVRTPSAFISAGDLSGGNQQKVIVARELSRDVSVVIANQPTRGLDVGSIEYIHKTLIRLRDEGAAVLVISSELDEIMSLSDRIAVMYRGEIVDVVDAKQTTREELGLLMAGSKS